MTPNEPTAYPYGDRWQIVTPEQHVAVTGVDPTGDPDLADRAPGARCSQCGKNSTLLP
jgi:hypothetical protein